MKSIYNFIFLILAITGYAQIVPSPEWENTKEPVNTKNGEEIELKFTATIDPVWYLYSSDFDPDLERKWMSSDPWHRFFLGVPQ